MWVVLRRHPTVIQLSSPGGQEDHSPALERIHQLPGVLKTFAHHSRLLPHHPQRLLEEAVLVLGDRRWARHRGASEGEAGETRNGGSKQWRSLRDSSLSGANATIHGSDEVGWEKGEGKKVSWSWRPSSLDGDTMGVDIPRNVTFALIYCTTSTRVHFDSF